MKKPLCYNLLNGVLFFIEGCKKGSPHVTHNLFHRLCCFLRFPFMRFYFFPTLYFVDFCHIFTFLFFVSFETLIFFLFIMGFFVIQIFFPCNPIDL
jgi:hypothetical protein